MNEPQSTVDADPASVPDAATASDPTPEVPIAPEAPPVEPEGPVADEAAPRDVDTSEDTLAEHVARTDAALVAWRQDAERRRLAWEASQARALEQMRAQRRRVVRFAAVTGLIGLGIGFAAGVLFYRTWWLGVSRGAELEPPPTSTAPVPAALARPEVPPPAAEPAPTPGPEVVAPLPATDAEPLALIDGSARVWSEGAHTWASFESRVAGELTLRYVDGAGQPALEPMECQAPGPDGIRRCAAGRSAARIDAAVAAGASPGTWTVQACAPAGCVPVGTFEVAGGAG